MPDKPYHEMTDEELTDAQKIWAENVEQSGGHYKVQRRLGPESWPGWGSVCVLLSFKGAEEYIKRLAAEPFVVATYDSVGNRIP